MKFDISSNILLILFIFPFASSGERQDLIVSVSDSVSKEDEEFFSVENEDNSNIFIPSNEWKVVEEGQSIPAGLHVRMNLATGVKEAKLMGDSEAKSESTPNSQIHYDDLKLALKNFKDEVLQSEYKSDGVKTKFRPIKALKEEFDKMNLNVESDTEILKRLTDNLKKENVSDSDTKFLLLEIEYLVHQIDNALNLIELDGLDTIIHILNSTNPELRSSAAFVLGSAMQSNSKVQIAVLEKAVMPQLLRMIARDYYTEELSVNYDKTNDKQKERAKQYSRVKIKELFANEGFCKVLVQLLPVNDHDTKEIVINSMLMLFNKCKSEFQGTTELLEEYRHDYKILSEKERLRDEIHDEDEYFFKIYKNIDNILSKLLQLGRNEL